MHFPAHGGMVPPRQAMLNENQKSMTDGKKVLVDPNAIMSILSRTSLNLVRLVRSTSFDRPNLVPRLFHLPAPPRPAPAPSFFGAEARR